MAKTGIGWWDNAVESVYNMYNDFKKNLPDNNANEQQRNKGSDSIRRTESGEFGNSTRKYGGNTKDPQ